MKIVGNTLGNIVRACQPPSLGKTLIKEYPDIQSVQSTAEEKDFFELRRLDTIGKLAKWGTSLAAAGITGIAISSAPAEQIRSLAFPGALGVGGLVVMDQRRRVEERTQAKVIINVIGHLLPTEAEEVSKLHLEVNRYSNQLNEANTKILEIKDRVDKLSSKIWGQNFTESGGQDRVFIKSILDQPLTKALWEKLELKVSAMKEAEPPPENANRYKALIQELDDYLTMGQGKEMRDSIEDAQYSRGERNNLTEKLNIARETFLKKANEIWITSPSLREKLADGDRASASDILDQDRRAQALIKSGEI